MAVMTRIKSVAEYIEYKRPFTLDSYESEFRSILGHISHFKRIDSATRMLEIGSGTGWFELWCARHGLQCRGLELRQEFIDYSREFGSRHGISPDIVQGDIETVDLGQRQYDVVIGCSVFEHVEDWQAGMRRVFDALDDGGIFYMVSTNKFSPFRSGECDIPVLSGPLYTLLPDRIRHEISWRAAGRPAGGLAECCAELNQFHFFGLRRAMLAMGFSHVHSFVDFAEPRDQDDWKSRAFIAARRWRALKPIMECFAPVTLLVAVK